MNAGQYLVALSGLPTGTAAAHLMAIQAGGGAGTGQTVFARQLGVTFVEPGMPITLLMKRAAVDAVGGYGVLESDSPRRVYSRKPAMTMYVQAETNALYATEVKRPTLHTTVFDRKHTTTRGIAK